MRGILVFVASGLGLGAFWRRRRSRQAAAELPYTVRPEEIPAGPDPAEELRAKLAQSKAAGAEDEHDDAREALPAEERSPLDPQVRRQDVHDRARASLDELR